MQGRTVTVILFVLAAVLAAGMWGAGQWTVRNIDQQARAHGVPRLSPEEAAERVAREDRFGLPSRLEDPPARDIERFRKVGTPDNPFSVDKVGVEALVDVYEVSVEGCAKSARLRSDVPVELQLVVGRAGGFGQVTEVVPSGSDEAWTAFSRCLVGSLRGAVFVAPDAPVLLRTAVELP
jgi:hypothetical protein